MEYWHLRLLNNWWTAPLLKTHYSIIPLFQYSNPVKWVGATLACLHDLPTPAEARASRRRERFGEGRSPKREADGR